MLHTLNYNSFLLLDRKRIQDSYIWLVKCHQYQKKKKRFYCIHLLIPHLKQRAQEAAGAGGDEDAGVVEWDVGWERVGAGLWVCPGPAEQTGWILTSWGRDQASPPPRHQQWPDRSPGSVWPGTQPSHLLLLDPPHLKQQFYFRFFLWCIIAVFTIIIIICTGNS